VHGGGKGRALARRWNDSRAPHVGGDMNHLQRLVAFLFTPPLTAPKSTLLLRLMAGGVFLSEGILKFVYTNQGVGRFTKLGLPFPHETATSIGSLEIVGGLLIIVGLFTRIIAIPFIVEMVVAILATKVALYLGTSPLPLPPAPPMVGFWAVMHETRSDYAQILTSIFLLVAGPGSWSLDAVLNRRRKTGFAVRQSQDQRLSHAVSP
jgi:putative oxidoreductase